MTAGTLHRIARQSVELHVNSDAAAGDMHAELSASLHARTTPVLDDVLTALCPPDVTMRIERVEIDAGVVTPAGLMEAIASAMRDQLPALLTSSPIDAGGTSSAPSLKRLSAEEIALDRMAAFLEHGVTTWRDASLTREALESTLLDLIDAAPAALRRLLSELPPSPVARRIRAQFSIAARHRLLAWLGAADPAELDRVVADWTALFEALEAINGSRPIPAASQSVDGWVFERIWMRLIDRGRADVTADAIGQELLDAMTVDMPAAAAALLLEMFRIEAERLLSRDGKVRAFITERAAALAREWHTDPRMRRLVRQMHAQASRQIADGASEEAGFGDLETADADRARLLALDATTSNASQGDERDAPDIGPDASTSDDADRLRQSAIARLVAARREIAATRPHTKFGSEPLWVAHAGAVIVWPFLPGFFEACGLVADKQFVDDAARERAVLLTAHLVNGLEEWGEHDLLLEKTLCGCAGDQAMASRLEVRDEERRQAEELLASVVGHWTKLAGTSVDGLRRAFLCRPGTMTTIASGWKLEIPRAGHDVLLDSLPWGIGLVLLPWMDQPLHVEW